MITAVYNSGLLDLPFREACTRGLQRLLNYVLPDDWLPSPPYLLPLAPYYYPRPLAPGLLTNRSPPAIYECRPVCQ